MKVRGHVEHKTYLEGKYLNSSYKIMGSEAVNWAHLCRNRDILEIKLCAP